MLRETISKLNNMTVIANGDQSSNLIIILVQIENHLQKWILQNKHLKSIIHP